MGGELASEVDPQGRTMKHSGCTELGAALGDEWRYIASERRLAGRLDEWSMAEPSLVGHGASSGGEVFRILAVLLLATVEVDDGEVISVMLGASTEAIASVAGSTLE